METDTAPSRVHKITRAFNPATNLPKALILLALVSIVSGVITGFMLSRKSTSLVGTGGSSGSTGENSVTIPDQQEQKVCRDFAEGTIKVKPESSDSTEYTEGTHLLDRGAGQYPVTLTSSSVDLSKSEGKKVKIFGETQKALKAGWLMDVCKVEEK